jgi:hypothetical protein
VAALFGFIARLWEKQLADFTSGSAVPVPLANLT